MRRADISPCNNLPYIYGFIDKSVFETMLNTCKNIDNPPKPSKRDVSMILIDSSFMDIDAINDIPFVISKRPFINGAIKKVGILMSLKIGENINVKRFNNLLDLSIEIITENNTTNPPIIIILDIEEETELDRTSPIFDTFILFLESPCFLLMKQLSLYFSFFFQKLKRNPTIKQDRI